MALLIKIERLNDDMVNNKAPNILLFRTALGCSIKEAKEMVDAMCANPIECPKITLRINDDTKALKLLCAFQAPEASIYVNSYSYVGDTKQDFTF